jgi:ketosteroid isomerase-like protein
MSTEQNTTLVRRYWEEVWNNGNLAVVDELIATDFDGHPLPGEPDFGRGPAGQNQLVGMYRTAFPDLRMTIEDLTAEGDRVAEVEAALTFLEAQRQQRGSQVVTNLIVRAAKRNGWRPPPREGEAPTRG